jgi:general secretion pathway protein L
MRAVAGDHLLDAQGIDPFPTEHVLLLPVSFPPMTAARRRTAALFAVEAQLARPIEEVHASIVGPASSVGDAGAAPWLVAVVDRRVLAGWRPSRSPRRRLVPDVLCLPRPQPGTWSVWEAHGRVLVRTPDGAGFVIGRAAFDVAHRLGGAPQIDLFGGDLSEDTAVRRVADFRAIPDPALRGFDLRRREAALPTLRLGRVAAVGVLAGLGQIGLLLADVASLRGALHTQQTSFAEVVSLAGLPPSTTPEAVLLLRDRAQAPARATPVLPAVAAAVEALAGAADGIGLRELTFEGNPRALILTAEGPDLAALQQVERAFGQYGLTVEAGPAVNDGGVAEQTFTLRGDGT